MYHLSSLLLPKLTQIDMLNALRSGLGRQLLHQPTSALASVLRFASGGSGEMDSNSNKQIDPKSKSVDAMASFGEGYATRSDDDGFGGVYGGNHESDDDKNVHGHEVDHNQGSEVKEEEKARNQEKLAN